MSPVAAQEVKPNVAPITHHAKRTPVEMIEVKPTEHELLTGRLSDENIQLFLSGMHRDGCVVLKDVIDPAHLDLINEFMEEDAKKEVQKANHHVNFGVENIQQSPPLYPSKYFFDDVYLNKLLFHGITLYLGQNAQWNFISGNSALPNGKSRQPAHSDAMGVHPLAPHFVLANIPLVTATPENGGTEIWLGGTHHYTWEHQVQYKTGATCIADDVREERAKIQPGQQYVITKGSILVRDSRVWHAGMPNKTDRLRFMISLGFVPNWVRDSTLRFPIPGGVEDIRDRIYHGTKNESIIPFMTEVPVEKYDEIRNSHDWYFPKKDIKERNENLAHVLNDSKP